MLLPDGTMTAAETDVALEHAADVVGLLPDADVTLRLRGETEAGVAESEPFVVHTAPLSAEVERPVTDIVEGGAGGYWAVPVFDAGTAGVVSRVLIVDAAGEVVWARLLDGGWVPTSVEFDLPRGRLLAVATDQVISIDLVDGTQKVVAQGFLHHDFTVLPDGTVAAISRRLRTLPDGAEQWLDDVVEIDPAGELRTVLTADDMVAQLGLDLDTLAGVPELGLDPMHANALEYDAERGHYVIGLPGLRTVAAFDRQDGRLVYALGLQTAVERPSPYLLHHQVHLLDDGFQLFVNQTEDEACARTVTLRWQGAALVEQEPWPLDRCEPIVAWGGNLRLEDGHRLVAWSHQGVVERVAEDGRVVQRYTFPAGTAVGYPAWSPSLQPGG